MKSFPLPIKKPKTWMNKHRFGGSDARHKFPLGIDFIIGNIGRKIGNMSENNYPTYFGNLL